MKQTFNQNAGQTYADRKEALAKQAEAIEKRLNTPRTPQPELKPKGPLAAAGQAYARKAMQTQKTDIEAELKAIQKEMDQRKTIKPPSKSKTY
ncbi:MAG: hypothetical protein AAF583_13110 [Pseudomonadota bacterium]